MIYPADRAHLVQHLMGGAELVFQVGGLPYVSYVRADLLFNDMPKPLLEKVEQIVHLVRSKGVGVYFCTQNPADIPESILGQLGNCVQHALRAYTPNDKKAVKVAANTF